MTPTTTEILQFDAFVGGEWRPPAGDKYMASIDPADGSEYARIAECSAEDVDFAVRNANAAFPVWRDTPPAERGRVLMRIAERIKEDADRLADLEMHEAGKPLREAQGDMAVS